MDENGPLIVDLPIRVVIFQSYVSLPESSFCQWRVDWQVNGGFMG